MAQGRPTGVPLRPLPHLFRQALLAVLAFMTPVFIVMYALTVPGGPWEAVLATHILITLLVALAFASFFRVGIWVDSTSITEVGFFGKTTRVEADQISSVFLAEVFEASGTTTLPQLFVRDLGGAQVIRMRGQFWSRESMELVLSTLEVPSLARDDSVSTRELGDEYPGLLYWFERRPVLASLAGAAGALAVTGGIYYLFKLAGFA